MAEPSFNNYSRQTKKASRASPLEINNLSQLTAEEYQALIEEQHVQETELKLQVEELNRISGAGRREEADSL